MQFTICLINTRQIPENFRKLQKNISNKRKEFVWGEVPKYVDFDILEKSIKTVGLNELLNIFPEMLEGKLKNRILVDVNK